MDQNLEQALRASELIVKYLENSLEDDEPQELDSWTEESEENRCRGCPCGWDSIYRDIYLEPAARIKGNSPCRPPN